LQKISVHLLVESLSGKVAHIEAKLWCHNVIYSKLWSKL